MAHSAGIVYWEEAEVREWLISLKIPSLTDTAIDSCGFIGVDLLTLDEQVSTISYEIRSATDTGHKFRPFHIYIMNDSSADLDATNHVNVRYVSFIMRLELCNTWPLNHWLSCAQNLEIRVHTCCDHRTPWPDQTNVLRQGNQITMKT